MERIGTQSTQTQSFRCEDCSSDFQTKEKFNEHNRLSHSGRRR